MTELRVPATEVAGTPGRGVAVPLKIYAHRIEGQANAASKRITDAPASRKPGKTQRRWRLARDSKDGC